ncbi:MAG: hypothetical protein A2138_06730 [Deltaproteobacteria bacterium RBG_16_71_12]|nr:MAG: hypothetical protein A2138_06730 [Deltaproteobacteria bacterium RBG_16_71_12]
MQNAELRSAQDALATSRERYFRLYDLAPVGYLMLDDEGRIVEANLTAAELVGVDRAALVGAPLTRFIAAADQDRYYLQRRAALGDGAGFTCDLRLASANLPARWVRMDVKPASGAAKGDLASWATLTDITESRRLADELAHANRMIAVGALASGVAHEFNNMLAVVLGHVELIAETLPPNAAIGRDLAAIATAARRARDIVRQLVAFARKQELSPRPIDLRAAASDLERMLRTQLRTGVTLRFELADGVGAPFVDAVQLDQVLLNLALNARDAMPHGGELVIHADNVDVRAHDPARGEPPPPGGYVRIRVADTGTGIPADVVPHLFEPFFTTKPFGHGTGLGLAIVHGIVTQSGGHIDVESPPGRGSTFTILLPRAALPPPSSIVPAVAPRARRYRGRVLLVDDEPQLRRVMRHWLSRLGFEVDDAPSGAIALDLFTADPDRYRLVVTDVSMPGMDGPTLVRRLAELGPAIPVLFVTGYLEAEQGPDAAPKPGRGLLNKPFGADELAAAIAGLLPDGA